MSRFVAFVLAAGAGERMGGPKALLVIDGVTLAEGHVRRALEAGCDEVILATRPELVAKFVNVIADARVRVVPSAAPDPAGTLAVAVRQVWTSIDDATSAVAMIAPVDTLPASVTTIAALRDAIESAALAATPTRGARGGHPVICKMHVLAAYATESAPAPLRDTLRALGDGRVRVPVDEASIAIDLDTPEDVARLTGASVRWRA